MLHPPVLHAIRTFQQANHEVALEKLARTVDSVRLIIDSIKTDGLCVHSPEMTPTPGQ